MNKCAFDNGKKCSALKKKQCAGCRFRKNEEDVILSRQKSSKRVNNLPGIIKSHILRKYYDGRYREDWLE